MSHSNRSKRNPKPDRNPRPAEISAAREKVGLSQKDAARMIYCAAGAWENWEQGLRAMHPAFFELFLLKTGQSDLGVIRPGTIDTPARYEV